MSWSCGDGCPCGPNECKTGEKTKSRDPESKEEMIKRTLSRQERRAILKFMNKGYSEAQAMRKIGVI